jgi:hypothetical protein
MASNVATVKPKLVLKKIITKGIGAGGANTNKNGLSYEKLTELDSEYKVVDTYPHAKTITFNCNPSFTFYYTKQSHFYKHMDKHVNKEVCKAHGCKNPDECYIHEPSKTIFIIEKKFQQVGGSVCEKIQTPDFKIWQYERSFPDFTIVYMYCLSHWFKENCKAELEYLEYKKIPVFWGNKEEECKKAIASHIVDYVVTRS